MYKHIQIPSAGEKISVRADGTLDVPDHPVVPFIEGDGTGVDITPVMKEVVDAAVGKAYGGRKRISWMAATWKWDGAMAISTRRKRRESPWPSRRRFGPATAC